MWLTIQSGPASGKRTQASGKRFTIGREATCDLVLDDPKVSRIHASIEVKDDGTAVLTDLGSANGTLVDGKRLAARESITLRGGERIKVGETELQTEAPAGASAPTAGAAAGTIVTPSVRPPAVSSPRSGGAASPPPAASYGSGPGGGRRRIRGGVVAAIVVAAAIIAVVVLFATGVFSGDDELSEPEVIEQVTPSTVWVETLAGDQRQGSGSGWVYDAEAGLVVTNYHVVAPGTQFRVGTVDGEREASLVAAAPCEDLAMLRIPPSDGLRTLPLGQQSDVQLGESVVAMGFPGNASITPELQTNPGSITAVGTTVRVPQPDLPIIRNGLQTDAAINPGNSGGPLVDLQGDLVGVNFAGGGENQGLAIGVDSVAEVTPVLADDRSIGWTGMSIDFGLVPGAEERLFVAQAIAGTGAADAGFGQGDIRWITRINNTPIDDGLQSYCAAVQGIQSGDLARFTYVPISIVGGQAVFGQATTSRVQFE